MSGDSQAQEDELLALASIYSDPDIFATSSSNDKRIGYFRATLKLPENFHIRTTKLGDASERIEMCHAIEYLPPITLHFQLPLDYPSLSPPQFTLSCQWLSPKQLSALCKKLDDICTENQGFEVLFLWTSFLKDETLTFLSIDSPLDVSCADHHSLRNNGDIDLPCRRTNHNRIPSSNDTLCAAGECQNSGSLINNAGTSADSEQYDSRAVQDIGSQDLLYRILIEYNKAQCHHVFLMRLFTCGVCFMEKPGSQCIQFYGCGHVYCKHCMSEYFKVLISEGNVQGLVCPSDKCQSEAHPLQVKELVGQDLFSRYDQLLLQSSLDTMSDIMYCPRKLCGCPVMLDQESNLGTCPLCRFVFCRFCKLVYHGVSPCRIKADEIQKLCEEYVNATEDEKKQMEQKYGRLRMQQLLQEQFSEDWLQKHSKMCPSCGTYIQKIDGCNKMTCMKCRCYFCWLCGTVLSHKNPYSHYNDPDTECFQRLFHGVLTDEDNEEEWAYL